MVWTPVYLTIALGLILIGRLWSLRLHRVYRVFSAFLVFELFGQAFAALNRDLHFHLDYRLLWIGLAVPEWVLIVWMVYALLDAILHQLPGLLVFSQRLLKMVFAGAAAVVSVPAVASLKSSGALSAANPVHGLIIVGVTLDRAVVAVALLSLFAILTFLLWFPVPLPRNLVLFSFGLVVFFAFRTASLLARFAMPRSAAEVLATISLLALPGCYAYWIATITASGEQTSVRVGHGWSPQDRERLVSQLESMNAALLGNLGDPKQEVSSR